MSPCISSSDMTGSIMQNQRLGLLPPAAWNTRVLSSSEQSLIAVHKPLAYSKDSHLSIRQRRVLPSEHETSIERLSLLKTKPAILTGPLLRRLTLPATVLNEVMDFSLVVRLRPETGGGGVAKLNWSTQTLTPILTHIEQTRPNNPYNKPPYPNISPLYRLHTERGTSV